MSDNAQSEELLSAKIERVIGAYDLTGMMSTCPPPGTAVAAVSSLLVEHNCPLGRVTYVSVPIDVMRCFVTLGFERQNQHSSAVTCENTAQSADDHSQGGSRTLWGRT